MLQMIIWTKVLMLHVLYFQFTASDNVSNSDGENSRAMLNVSELLESLECGIVAPEVEDRRIVGGYPSKLGAWPWMALLGYVSFYEIGLDFKCDGSLITHRHVLTAGHCVYGWTTLYAVRLGELELDNDQDGATPLDVPISRRIVHEDYEPKTLVNDIAILELRDEVNFTTLIRPICLPLAPEIRSKDFVGYYPYIAGWGYTDPGTKEKSLKLMQVQMPVISQARCREQLEPFRGLNATAYVDNRILCAGYRKGGKDACTGDSGGAMMWPRGELYYQIGIISGGIGCARENVPGLYSRVSEFLDWIIEHL
ncbi:venom protease-like [Periplaneta americana]|uniref:venom protease-like n=1 Tax=Periplaneta americana TaxID=6978 RepID=UPI0037E70A68